MVDGVVVMVKTIQNQKIQNGGKPGLFYKKRKNIFTHKMI